MSAYTDLVKLAKNGRIPREVPAHYVQWALKIHKESRGLCYPRFSWKDVKPNIIYL